MRVAAARPAAAAPSCIAWELSMAYEMILLERRGGVALITLNRPKVLNALSHQTMTEMAAATAEIDADDTIGCVVLTGNDKAFAAGADIKEMIELGFVDAYFGDHLALWDRVAACRKPMIAAVAGYALGGGCELAMMCDFILAADNARFGQPEVAIGTMPGMGGSQRLARFVGKSKAMEMCLTGRQMDAAEAERAGLVSRVLPLAELLPEALRTAEKIASLSRPAVMLIKEAVDRAFDTPLDVGIRFERRVFHATFATEDRKEGMTAFVEKRPPVFRHR